MNFMEDELIKSKAQLQSLASEKAVLVKSIQELKMYSPTIFPEFAISLELHRKELQLVGNVEASQNHIAEAEFQLEKVQNLVAQSETQLARIRQQIVYANEVMQIPLLCYLSNNFHRRSTNRI